ncbi:hypothetical protein QJS66_14825 [Kocuria rhizophila]|nr:hypothetical protein QJS66_14825 [Kocuria rhizophila]
MSGGAGAALAGFGGRRRSIEAAAVQSRPWSVRPRSAVAAIAVSTSSRWCPCPG